MQMLPNQVSTWEKLSDSVEEFSEWQQRTEGKFASVEAELLTYLADQLRAESRSLEDVEFNHPVMGLLSHMSEQNNRMRELLLAYLSITVTGDIGPAQRIIAGQRLQVGLCPDYVAVTQCH